MFLTKPYETIPSFKRQISHKRNKQTKKKNSTSRIFDANNIFVRSYVCHIGLYCPAAVWLQNDFNTIKVRRKCHAPAII